LNEIADHVDRRKLSEADIAAIVDAIGDRCIKCHAFPTEDERSSIRRIVKIVNGASSTIGLSVIIAFLGAIYGIIKLGLSFWRGGP